MEKTLKIKSVDKESKGGFMVFNLTVGKVAEFKVNGKQATRTSKKSYWLLVDPSPELKKLNEGDNFKLDTDDFKLERSSYKDEDSGETRFCTWLIPSDLADNSCEDWD